MNVITTHHLTTGYDKIPVVSDLNLEIEKGSYTVICGDNGTGKSTLMKTLLGLIPPVSGTYKIEPNQVISYVPQRTEVPKDFPATVAEVIMSGYKRYLNKTEREAKVQYFEEFFDIEDLHNKSYRELSGGQQQRVLLTRALAIQPTILFLDEPVTGLDMYTSQTLYEMLEKLNKEQGITIVMITHDKNAIEYANHVIPINPKE